jgi:preprotein translocase subunit SecB
MATKTKREEPSKGDGPPSAPASAGKVAAPTPEAPPSPATAAQLNVLGQYIKDLSFENPGAPQALQAPGQNPQLQVSVNVNATPRPEDLYEVTLNLEVNAKSDAGVIYNVELIYAGLFRLRNIAPNLLQPVLLVDCPTILFPFLRRVLADITRDGGFPPLMLDPVDFGRLYAQNLARAQGQAEAHPTKN